MPAAARLARIAGVVATLAIACAACGAVAVDPTPSPSTVESSGAAGATPAATPASAPAGIDDVSATGPSGATETARVVRVVDGDTIVIDRGHGSEKLRYIGIDTPEDVKPDTPVQFMAREAAAANAALVDGQRVVLERDRSETDRYGRLLRYVWLQRPGGWLFVNEALVRGGYARAVEYPPDTRDQAVLNAAERDARAAGLGLWRAGAPTPTPAATPAARVSRPGCDPAYPTVCIPPPPPDLDCADITFRRFTVLPPDPHRFDIDANGIGCEGDP